MSFVKTRRIRFSDCDPAGIVFYPQYFVLFNDHFEEWIDSILPEGFAGYIVGQRFGLPTVHLEADFKGISRMGDDVSLSLELTRIGARSFELALSCSGADGKIRMSIQQTIVTTSLDTHKSIPIPPMLLEALNSQFCADLQRDRNVR